MKLNLIYAQAGDVRNGYTNLNQFKIRNEELEQDLHNLDNLVDDGEVEEILAYDVIDYLDASKVEATIDHWIRKLKVGGKIVVSGTDIIEVAKGVASYKLTISDANQLLYNVDKNNPRTYKKVAFSCGALKEYMAKKHGLKIVTARINGYQMVVSAEKQ